MVSIVKYRDWYGLSQCRGGKKWKGRSALYSHRAVPEILVPIRNMGQTVPLLSLSALMSHCPETMQENSDRHVGIGLYLFFSFLCYHVSKWGYVLKNHLNLSSAYGFLKFDEHE